ncbi:hypothetical protein [Pseudomonas chlororaphis]|uniref:hypothetical protein n=1 Tax=Pseudomonas chlororaphis TaxID=587753 RepID=UPI001FF092EB|nr:hypothetical protein [Pseudomonas chlororaphis]
MSWLPMTLTDSVPFIVLGLAAQYVDRGGRIIALSISAIVKAPPTYGSYIVSKAGVEALVDEGQPLSNQHPAIG